MGCFEKNIRGSLLWQHTDILYDFALKWCLQKADIRDLRQFPDSPFRGLSVSEAVVFEEGKVVNEKVLGTDDLPHKGASLRQCEPWKVQDRQVYSLASQRVPQRRGGDFTVAGDQDAEPVLGKKQTVMGNLRIGFALVGKPEEVKDRILKDELHGRTLQKKLVGERLLR